MAIHSPLKPGFFYNLFSLASVPFQFICPVTSMYCIAGRRFTLWATREAESQIQSLGGEDPLEKEMATQSSILAWEILWTEGAWWATVHGVTERHNLAVKQQQANTIL